MSISTSTRWPSRSVPSRHPVCPASLGRLSHDVVAFLREVPGDDQRVDRPTDGLVRRVAEEPRRGRVPAGDRLISIHRHHRDRADLDERLEVLLLLAVALLRLLRRLEQPGVLDRDRRLLREPDEEVEVVVGERVRGARRAPDRHHPDDLTSRDERRGHQALLVLVLCPRDLHRARVAEDVVDDLRRPAEREVADDPLAGCDRVAHERLAELAEGHDRHEAAVALQEDRARVGVEQFACAFADLAAGSGSRSRSAPISRPSSRERRHLARTASRSRRRGERSGSRRRRSRRSWTGAACPPR